MSQILFYTGTKAQFDALAAKNEKAEDANTVNADRTTETQAAVSASAGTATTARQRHGEAK